MLNELLNVNKVVKIYLKDVIIQMQIKGMKVLQTQETIVKAYEQLVQVLRDLYKVINFVKNVMICQHISRKEPFKIGLQVKELIEKSYVYL